LNDFFIQNSIDYAFLPTKIAELFFELKNTSLKNLITGGDKLKKFIPQLYQVTNAYGPTEATVQITGFIIDKPYTNIPIGKLLNNAKCYIVDNNLNPLPIGVFGELVIGGEVLARGYYNHPELTAEKFIANPFQTKEEKVLNKNARIYKTGDLVRWLPDGNLEYIGRNDFQVKIRGFRIELSEIENKLTNHPEIDQAIVIAKEEAGNKYLVAYYAASKKLEDQEFKEYLNQQLPSYMVPDIYIHMEKFPLNRNGKLDRKALPNPEFINQDNYVAPTNQHEKLICDAFSKVLNLEKVGINDDFFPLGGNSISAIKLVSLLHINFDIKIADIFNLRAPRRLAKNIKPGEFLQTITQL
jgi:acyl-CoA synthetase (AMP-forming)/AMP-acid ligase II